MSYTFCNVYVNGYYRDTYKVNLADVTICKRCDGFYFIRYAWGSVSIDVDEIDINFEAMFPNFPYDKTKSGETSQISQISQLKHLEQRVDKIENDIVKLLSHVEAIMTVLKQRLPTDEPLTL